MWVRLMVIPIHPKISGFFRRIGNYLEIKIQIYILSLLFLILSGVVSISWPRQRSVAKTFYRNNLILFFIEGTYRDVLIQAKKSI